MSEVVWKKLEEVVDIYTGEQLNKDGMQKAGQYPVMNGGTSYSGYTEEYNEERNTVTISQGGASAGFVNWLDTEFWLGAHCYAVKPKKNVDLSKRFLYHFLKNNEYVLMQKKQGAGIPGLNRSSISNISFHYISLESQQAIVNQLDTFTSLISRLESELELRQKQYEHYRENYYVGLWSIATNDKVSNEVGIKSFSELGEIIRGKRFVRDDIKEKGQPCIHYGDMYTYYGISARQTKTFLDYDSLKAMRYASKGDVVIVGAGENNIDIGVGVAWIGDEQAAVHDACYILKHEINALYISYYLRTNLYHRQLKKFVSEGKICSFSAEGLGKVYIPVPKDPERQQQIVDKFDMFEQLIAALKREIALRKKQYAYYRDKLLTFE